MNKKVITIISSLIILAISVTLLLIIVLGMDKKNDDDISHNDELSCSVDDLNISVGDKIFDFYSFNKLNVEVSFSLDKLGIININENYIESIKVGEVTVTISGVKGNEVCSKQFVVTVKDNEYNIKIVPVLNCRYDDIGKIIYMEANSCHFYVEVYNNIGNKIENVNYDIVYEEGEAILKHELIDYILITNDNCKLIFKFENSTKLIEVNVVIFNDNIKKDFDNSKSSFRYTVNLGVTV